MANGRTDTQCANCEEPVPGNFGLPVDNNGDFICIGDGRTPWGAVPSCEVCHDLHAAAGTAGRVVLGVYAKATTALREKVRKFRRCRAELGDLLADMEAE